MAKVALVALETIRAQLDDGDNNDNDNKSKWKWKWKWKVSKWAA